MFRVLYNKYANLSLIYRECRTWREFWYLQWYEHHHKLQLFSYYSSTVIIVRNFDIDYYCVSNRDQEFRNTKHDEELSFFFSIIAKRLNSRERYIAGAVYIKNCWKDWCLLQPLHFRVRTAVFIEKPCALFVTINGDDVALFGQIRTTFTGASEYVVPKEEAKPIVNGAERSDKTAEEREMGVSLIGRN